MGSSRVTVWLKYWCCYSFTEVNSERVLEAKSGCQGANIF